MSIDSEGEVRERSIGAGRGGDEAVANGDFGNLVVEVEVREAASEEGIALDNVGRAGLADEDLCC